MADCEKSQVVKLALGKLLWAKCSGVKAEFWKRTKHNLISAHYLLST